MTGDQITTLCLGVGNLLVSILLVVLSFLFFNKKEKIYLKKQEAIYQALAFLDKYLSWLNYNTNSKMEDNPIRDIQDTEESITLNGRKCYNDLVCSCEKDEIIKSFLDVIFENEDTLLRYNKFRNLCREELGLKKVENLSNERIFLSKISTEDLARKRKSRCFKSLYLNCSKKCYRTMK